MKKIIFIIIFLICIKTGNAQTGDSLKISPNPFDSTTTFIVDLVSTDTISGFVYDRFGQVLDTIIFNTILAAGHYEFIINTINWQNSPYLFFLNFSDGRQIAKRAIKDNTQTSITTGQISSTIILTYPNPTSDAIVLTKVLNGTATITDLNGIIVKSVVVNGTSISIKELSNGQYIVRLSNNDKSLEKTFRIIKNE